MLRRITLSFCIAISLLVVGGCDVESTSSTSPAETDIGEAEPDFPSPRQITERPLPEEPPFINWGDQTIYMGYRRDETYSVRFHFGVEQIEDGKVSTFRRQQWLLSCLQDLSTDQRPWCSLQRIVVDDWEDSVMFPVITEHDHSTEDRTLRIVNCNWKRGVLDFEVVYEDGSTTDVMMRFKDDDGSLKLRDFQGAGISRGILSDSRSAIEYRIPEYTTVYEVPFEMRGWRSTGEKEWDELISELSEDDQAAWYALRENSATWGELAMERYGKIIAAEMPGFTFEKADEFGEPSEEQMARIQEQIAGQMIESFREWMATSDLSSEAQDRLLDHVSERFKDTESALSSTP